MFWCNKELLSALWSSYLFYDNRNSKLFKVFNPGLTSALYIPMLPVSFGNESSKRCGKWSLLKISEINQEPLPLGWPLMPLERQGAVVHSTVWHIPCGGGRCKRHGHKCALCRGVNSAPMKGKAKIDLKSSSESAIMYTLPGDQGCLRLCKDGTWSLSKHESHRERREGGEVNAPAAWYQDAATISFFTELDSNNRF